MESKHACMSGSVAVFMRAYVNTRPSSIDSRIRSCSCESIVKNYKIKKQISKLPVRARLNPHQQQNTESFSAVSAQEGAKVILVTRKVYHQRTETCVLEMWVFLTIKHRVKNPNYYF